MKNIIVNISTGIAAGTVNEVILAVADDAGNNNSVSFPCRIKAIYADWTFVFDSAQTAASVTWGLYKRTGGAPASGSSPSAIPGNNQQNSWFQIGRGIPGTADSGGQYRVVGWIRVPKRHQIFNEDDAFILSSVGTIGAHTVCSCTVYKWRT